MSLCLLSTQLHSWKMPPPIRPLTKLPYIYQYTSIRIRTELHNMLQTKQQLIALIKFNLGCGGKSKYIFTSIQLHQVSHVKMEEGDEVMTDDDISNYKKHF